jgi:lipoprotein-anchoring transpeptidase ErfK/SrfK
MRILTIAPLVAAIMLSGCSVPSQQRSAGGVAVPAAPAPQPPPYRWTHGAAPKAHKDMLATFSRGGLAPGQFVWAATLPAEGESRVVVDRLTQTLYAYQGDVLVGAASVSTASKGRITPLGFWSVLEKKKMHRSRKYDNAPMPFMQMYDEKGLAFHAGANPGYPASHGCVRLPLKFAERLYGMTKLGTKVIIEG